MALTQITQAPQQALATPSYDALYQGVAQGEGYKTAGARFKADSIKEGLQNFEKNQQLLSKHMGIFQGAISSNPEFKAAIEQLDPKSDLGKAVQDASRGNASLTSMLALSNFATEYGAGEAAQQQQLLNEETLRNNQMVNNAAAEVDNANEFLDALIDPTTNMINPAEIAMEIERMKKNGYEFGPGFRTALTKALEQRQEMGQIKTPLLQPNIQAVYKTPGDDSSGVIGYVISDRAGRPVTTFDLQDKQYDYNPAVQLQRGMKVIDSMALEKDADGNLKYSGSEIQSLKRGLMNTLTKSASSNNAVGQAYNIVMTELGITPYINGQPNPVFWDEVTRLIKLRLAGEKPSSEEAKVTMEEFTTSLMMKYGFSASEAEKHSNDALKSYTKATQAESGWE